MRAQFAFLSANGFGLETKQKSNRKKSYSSADNFEDKNNPTYTRVSLSSSLKKKAIFNTNNEIWLVHTRCSVLVHLYCRWFMLSMPTHIYLTYLIAGFVARLSDFVHFIEEAGALQTTS